MFSPPNPPTKREKNLINTSFLLQGNRWLSNTKHTVAGRTSI